jgi:hypothetical protein
MTEIYQEKTGTTIVRFEYCGNRFGNYSASLVSLSNDSDYLFTYPMDLIAEEKRMMDLWRLHYLGVKKMEFDRLNIQYN